MEILRAIIDIFGGLSLILIAVFILYIWRHNAKIEKIEKDGTYME